MKTRISNWLIKLAEKINPQERFSSIEKVDNYEAKRLGIGFAKSKKQIKLYRKEKKHSEGLSNRKADEMLTRELKAEVRQSIIRAIDEKGLIEYSVEKVGEQLHVTGELKVYIKKE
jgi:hypothetical protein|nr:MAG TPA: hypothetical protein [Caudoviricetes sp.]